MKSIYSQVFLKLRHESKVEHIFALESSAGEYKVLLDFLGLVEKFYYLSGRYDIELAVGDAAMENSFLRAIGHIDLDLPESPEKAARPPPQPIDPYLRFVPKQEISHIFRAPDKRPPQELSFAFLVLTLLPLVGFLIGVRVSSSSCSSRYWYQALLRLGVNLRGFPSSSVPAFCSILFHGGIGAILLLYVFFWLKVLSCSVQAWSFCNISLAHLIGMCCFFFFFLEQLDLFTTLEALGLLGVFLIFVGHRTLSQHASTSTKLKTT
ncbi:hypothetical protein GW17_00000152 [Ensete ventricosum]|nr:hypothetical protein GW17_00000152 [Ensete ventricosum]